MWVLKTLYQHIQQNNHLYMYKGIYTSYMGRDRVNWPGLHDFQQQAPRVSNHKTIEICQDLDYRHVHEN